MENTMKLIEEFFRTQQWKYKTQTLENNKGTLYKFGIHMENLIGDLPMFIHVGKSDYIVLATLHNKVEKDKLPAVAEYLHRANLGLKNGNFEIDYSDGEIRYKTYVNFDNATLSEKIIEDSVMIPVAMFEHYGTGLIQTMATGLITDTD